MKIPDEVKKLARAGKDKKIYAIHALRRATRLGLAEAKQMIEIIAAGGDVELPPDPPRPAGESREQRFRRQLETRVGTRANPKLNDDQIANLLRILQAEEDLLDLARATYDSNRGLLVATPQRLVFVCTDAVTNSKIEEFPLESIHLWRHLKDQLGSSLKIVMSNFRRAEFTDMSDEAAQSFYDSLEDRFLDVGSYDCGALGASDEIEQLEALYELCVIFSDELAAGKQKILRRWRKRRSRHHGSTGGSHRPS